MFESEETSAGSGAESDENSAAESNGSEGDEEEEDPSGSSGIPNVNIKGPGKVNVRNSSGVKIGNTINMTLNVDKMILQNEANQLADTAAIAGTDMRIRGMLEDIVAEHLPDIIKGERKRFPALMSAEEHSVGATEEVKDSGSYSKLTEKPRIFLIEPIASSSSCSEPIASSSNYNSMSSGLQCHKNKQTTEGDEDKSSDDQKEEEENFLFSAADIPDFMELGTTWMTKKFNVVSEIECKCEECSKKNMRNAETPSMNDLSDVFPKQLLSNCLETTFVGYIKKNSLSSIALPDSCKVFTDEFIIPVGGKIYVYCKDGMLDGFNSMFIDTFEHFEHKEAYIMVLFLEFHEMKFIFSSFVVYYEMSQPEPETVKVKGGLEVDLTKLVVPVTLLFKQDSAEIIRNIDEVQVKSIPVTFHLNQTRESLDQHCKKCLNFLENYIRTEYIDTVKELIKNSVSLVINDVLESDNTALNAARNILNRLRK